MNYVDVALVAVGVIYILFGFYVLIRRKADSIGIIFLAITLGIAVWNLSLAFIEAGIVTSKFSIIILDRIATLAIPIIGTSIVFYLLALWGGDWWGQAKKNKMVILLGTLAIINILLIPTNLISNNQGAKGMVIGPLWPLLGGYVLLVSVYVIYLCYVGRRNAPEDTKKKFWFVMLGYILAAVCGIVFDVVLPMLGYNDFATFGALSTIFIVWFVGLGVIGTTIAGTVIGVVSSVVATVVFSAVVLGMAFSLMFILFASLFRK